MKIDITTILNGRTPSLDFEYDLDALSAQSEVILPEDVTLPSPIRVAGTVKDQNGYMSLVCGVTVRYKTLCDRCLDEIDGTLEFELEKTVSTSEPPENFGDDPTYDEVVFVSESAIDLDPAVIEETVLRLPPYHLCSEDCPGLCPKCGKRLKDGPCACSDEKEIDPRLKILQKLLDNFD